MTTLDDLFLIHTTIDDRPVDVILRLASYADIAWVLEGNPPAEEERLWMVQRLTKEVATVDGQPITVTLATRLVGQPQFLRDFVNARNRLYFEARLAGVLFALCPGCRQGEAKVTVAHLEFGLRMTPPPLVTADGIWLEPPKIATVELKHGRRRGDLPLASQLRVELPSERLGLGSLERAGGCVLRVLDVTTETAAWDAYWPAGSKMPEERAWWYRGNAAFGTLMRLSAAIDHLTGGGPNTPSPSTLEVLPAIDIAYLDLIVLATQFTDEPPEEKPVPNLVQRRRTLPVTCPHCKTEYLPLL